MHGLVLLQIENPPRSLGCNWTRFRVIFRNSRTGGASKLGTFQYSRLLIHAACDQAKPPLSSILCSLQARAWNRTWVVSYQLSSFSSSLFFPIFSVPLLTAASSSLLVYSSFGYSFLSLLLVYVAFLAAVTALTLQDYPGL
jgi:hypothetical protein